MRLPRLGPAICYKAEVKKLVLLVVVLFIGFYLMTRPDSLADLSQDALSNGWQMLTRLFESVIDFVDALVT